MNEKSKSVAKALSALTLIIAGTAGVASAQDANVTSALGSSHLAAAATAIQFDEFNLGNGSGVLAAIGDHDHDNHDHEAANLASATTVGNKFDV